MDGEARALVRALVADLARITNANANDRALLDVGAPSFGALQPPAALRASRLLHALARVGRAVRACEPLAHALCLAARRPRILLPELCADGPRDTTRVCDVLIRNAPRHMLRSCSMIEHGKL